MPKRNVLLLLLITTMSLVAWLARDHGRQARQIGEVLGAIERSYLEPVDADLLEAAAVEGIMAKLDEHSALVAGAARRELEAALDQEFGGVGLELTASAEGIVYCLPQSRACVNKGAVLPSYKPSFTTARRLTRQTSPQRRRAQI